MNETVMVVGDDRDLREVLLNVLLAEGLRAEDGGDADHACARLDERPGSVLLIDPGRPGAALPTLESLGRRADCERVVVVVGCGRVQSRASELGLRFVRSPFDLDELLEALH